MVTVIIYGPPLALRIRMSKSKKKEIKLISEKQCWHPYKLQNLSMKKFIQAVNKVLNQELELLDIRREKRRKEEEV